MWADWEWPKGKENNVFQTHFRCLLIGQHPAGGSEARCSYQRCRNKTRGPVYVHHFFECVEYRRNRGFLRDTVRRLYNDYVMSGNEDIPHGIIDGILENPCGMWVGLFDNCFFDLGLNLRSAHELHRIVTIASILSWGRFYSVP